MGEVSASEQLHGLLMQEEVGYKFTVDDLWKPWLEDYGFSFWGTY